MNAYGKYLLGCLENELGNNAELIWVGKIRITKGYIEHLFLSKDIKYIIKTITGE